MRQPSPTPTPTPKPWLPTRKPARFQPPPQPPYPARSSDRMPRIRPDLTIISRHGTAPSAPTWTGNTSNPGHPRDRPRRRTASPSPNCSSAPSRGICNPLITHISRCHPRRHHAHTIGYTRAPETANASPPPEPYATIGSLPPNPQTPSTTAIGRPFRSRPVRTSYLRAL